MSSMTIFVDASFCPETKAAAWGAWVKADGWSRGDLYEGFCSMPVRSSSDAELVAIVDICDQLAANCLFDKPAYVVLQSDCVSALGLLLRHGKQTARASTRGAGSQVEEKRSADLSKLQRKALDRFNIAIPGNLRVWLRHVKGHSNGDDGRSWVNERCHNLAYGLMTKQRSEIQRAGSPPLSQAR